jgi:DNA-binding GntR family transcriptional regulator
MSSAVRLAMRGATLDRRGTADLIASDIRERILRGDLVPGDGLREADLAEAFSVARNTVREALRLLTRDGLATHEVHRGVTVRRHTPEEVREVFELRALLEAAAAPSAGRLTDEDVARFDAVLRASEQAAAADDVRGVLTHNLEFHREIVRLLRNPRINALFDQLLAEIRLILTSLGRDVAGPWLERNRDLLRLLGDGDEHRFSEALRRYIEDSDADVVRRMRSRADPSGSAPDA